jgi:gamma-F420-2:alpha-L-glutamate ligase
LETSQVLAKENLPMPKTILVKEKTDVGLIQKEVGFPCVVKATTGSHGNTVHLCEKKKDFNSLMGFLDAVSLKKTLIIQEFVDFAAGSDLRVWVIGGKTICAMKRTGPSGDFRANISAGGTGESYEVTPEIDFLAKETARVLGLEIAGVDLLFGSSGLLICEANSNPGFEGIDQYCNVDMAKHIVEYLQTKISP